MRSAWFRLTLVGVLVVAAACQQKLSMDPGSADAWSKIIIGHTTGVVSRHSEVRVLFAVDVAAGKALTAALTIEPAVQGEVTLRGARELVLTPKGALKPGQEYRASLSASALTGVPKGIKPYQFTFRIQTPQYDLSLSDLESDPADDRRMIQRGMLVTADAEDAAGIERMLSASYRGTALTATWTHGAEGREHGFTLASVERQKQPEVLRVALDGKPINAGRGDSRDVTVPPVGEFRVFNAQGMEEEGRQEIQVAFSDRLDERQDLKGLVQLSSGKFTTSIQGNRLTIFPDGETGGDVTLTLEPGIRNARGEKLAAQSVHVLSLASEKPQVRFVGNGVILPDAKVQTVAFEAVSARSVQVTATRVYPENIPQFLQVNRLGDDNEIGRVGRYLWRKTIALTGPNTGRWQRHELDVTELVRANPGALIQLYMHLTPADSAYSCPEGTTLRKTATGNAGLRDQESGDTYFESPWNYSESHFGVTEEEEGRVYDYGARWRERKDPCKNAYYQYGYNEGTRAQRNLLASNLGLLAKADARGRLLISVTNLATAQPESGVTLQLRNYQGQQVGRGSSDTQGLATMEPTGVPFLLVAESGAQRAYLKLNNAGALPVSHFDVGGESLRKGLKGAIYGERGVWRPGDPIALTFVVHDRERTLPANHPATLELLDPRGRSTQTLVNTTPVDGFYRFDVRTAADAPTGNWTAKVTLGDAAFTRTVKVETVMPNRLKVQLDLGAEQLGGGRPLAGTVQSAWLSGASAAGLKADVSVRLSPAQTKFNGFNNHVFDDPAREFRAEPEEVFAGELGAAGSARFEKKLDLEARPAGMLSAMFTTRVFERGGAFSINQEAKPYAPYDRFVGIRLPEAQRSTLQVNQEHTVDLVTVTAKGAATGGHKLSVKLYKVQWRWWWDRGEDSLAAYIARENSTRVSEATVTTDAQGKAQWKFKLAEAQWGRYLLRVCDDTGGHCAGAVFYADWPYWSGEGRDQTGPAATMLNLTADKASYQVGETATIQLPQSAEGRALLTVENGSSVLDARWVMPGAQNARVTIPITAAMTPNAYVAVTLIQPHAGKKNDRPIRLYGVIPLVVTDAATNLKPVLTAADEWRPESEVVVKVGEAQGRAMTYTLAVVDEGLLSLTNFRTPDLHGEFFRREALGVRTWDLFDEVNGAYGLELERLLALGGSDSAAANAANQQQSRFPPVAQVLGPFHLPAGGTQEQKIKLPRYVGAVRVMVVAGNNTAKPAAYGSAEKSVFVRQPLMILPTMPRVVGPGEEISVPVSVFAMDNSVRDVQLTIAPDAMFEVVGAASTTVSFTRIDEKLGVLKLRAANRIGNSKVKFTAASGRNRAQDEINIEVRAPNPPSTRMQTQMIKPGESWTAQITPHGLAGTNRVTLEVSRLPAINLESRLGYLVAYPHGCLEQTTSSVFPQLFLSSLMKLDDFTKRSTEGNIRAGIERLRLFQLGSGGFSYWPGETVAAGDGYHYWAATYASHFLIEAEKQGYAVPATMRAGVIRNLRNLAQAWRPENTTALNQVYRLYVLARAGQPEIGAMNRVREQRLDPVERWVLAAAYQLAGLRDAASALATGDPMAVRQSQAWDYTFGGSLRDHALVLQAMVVLGQQGRSEPLVREVARRLSDDGWYSTQETAYALLAMAQLAAVAPSSPIAYAQTLAGKTQNVTTTSAMQRTMLTVPDSGAELKLGNASQGVLFATVAVRGIPPVQQEEAASAGLELKVDYVDASGRLVDVSRLTQGTDVIVEIEVRNATRVNLDNIALTQLVPSGWEIHNGRLNEEDDGKGERPADYRYQEHRNNYEARADHVDIRDDRVMQYFSLRAGNSIRFQTRINAAYRGRFYLPGIVAEAMYDASKQARSAGRWVEVVAQ